MLCWLPWPSAMQAMQVACVTHLLLQCPDGCMRAPQLPLQLLELLPHRVSMLAPQGCLRLQGQQLAGKTGHSTVVCRSCCVLPKDCMCLQRKS